jgi:hypothetical protein
MDVGIAFNLAQFDRYEGARPANVFRCDLQDPQTSFAREPVDARRPLVETILAQ